VWQRSPLQPPIRRAGEGLPLWVANHYDGNFSPCEILLKTHVLVRRAQAYTAALSPVSSGLPGNRPQAVAALENVPASDPVFLGLTLNMIKLFVARSLEKAPSYG
jgi:hypothetical protein